MQTFCAKDLSAPEPEQTRLNLSAIINFLKFVEEREPFVSGLREKAQVALEERERLRRGVEERRGRVGELRCVFGFFIFIITYYLILINFGLEYG